MCFCKPYLILMSICVEHYHENLLYLPLCCLRLQVPNQIFFFSQEFKVTDDGDNYQDDATGSQLVQVQKKDSIIEKSFVKLKEASTVWISSVFHQSKYDRLSN
jgi:hypothetical protein